MYSASPNYRQQGNALHIYKKYSKFVPSNTSILKGYAVWSYYYYLELLSLNFSSVFQDPDYSVPRKSTLLSLNP